MLNLYGSAGSTCTRKVLMTLAETNTPFQLHAVDFAKREHKSAPHLGRQPFGRIPAIEDDGFEMFESRAICRYVNQKAHGSLVPSELRAAAKVEQWISVEASEFSPHAMKFIYEHTFKRKQETSVLEAAAAALEVTSAIMNDALARTPFIAGAELTLADICFMPYLEYAMTTPAKEIFAKHPHLVAWWAKLRERATWKKVLATR